MSNHRRARGEVNGQCSVIGPPPPYIPDPDEPPYPYDTFLITCRTCPAGTDPDAPLETLREQCAIEPGVRFDIMDGGFDRMKTRWSDPNGRAMLDGVERYWRTGGRWFIEHDSRGTGTTKPTVYGRFVDPPAGPDVHVDWQPYTVHRQYFETPPIRYASGRVEPRHDGCTDFVILGPIEMVEPMTFACEWFQMPSRDPNANPPPSTTHPDPDSGRTS